MKLYGLGELSEPSLWGGGTGISFIDSTSVAVCKVKRAQAHKTFKGLADRASSRWSATSFAIPSTTLRSQ
ncbi:MAG: transposase [Leptolyngbyaceae cyanobacterium]